MLSHCNNQTMYFFRSRDMCLNLPLHSVVPWAPRSCQTGSISIVGKSVFATFFRQFFRIIRFFHNPHQGALLKFGFNEIWAVYRTFQTKNFLPQTIAHFQFGLQTWACQASFGQFSRQPGPVFAGAPALLLCDLQLRVMRISHCLYIGRASGK